MPSTADALSLALQNHQAGDFQQAEQLYRHVLQAEPNNADAHHLLGVLAFQLGHLEQAASSIRHAIALNPTAATFYSNLGLAQEAMGQVELAMASYREALRLHPLFAEAHSNLGKAIQSQGRSAEAVAHFQEALRIRPNFADANNNLGSALLSLDRIDEAVACFHRALQANPRFAKAYNNLGNALEKQGKLDEALACYQQALTLEPSFVEAYDNMGIAFGRHEMVDEAIGCFQQVLRLRPGFAQGHYNLGCAYLDHGRPDLAASCFGESLRLNPDLIPAQSNYLFCLNYDPKADPDKVYAEHCRWGHLHTQKWLPHGNDSDPERRLRVGYVSPDFRGHALARYFEPVLMHHDPQKVEIFCYAEVARPDVITTRMQELTSSWRSTCRLTDAQIAKQIRDDRIDILVDLAGHTLNSRLLVFAHKPAPVQATWLGYMNTTGLTAVDYRITDAVLDPAGQPVRDVEELVRLPGGVCCFAPTDDVPDVAPLPALARGHITFGSLHNLFKINGSVIDLWCGVLRAVPTARLLMFHHTLKKTAKEHVLRQFQERGIAAERLDLRQGSAKPGYLGIYSEIDLCLDTFPCTGGVTTCESLWMGAPMISLGGVRPAGRNSAAMLARMNMSDWVVETPEQFMERAVQAAGDVDQLARLRTQLRERMATTLCDARQFTSELEDAYRTIWRRWCSQPLR